MNIFLKIFNCHKASIFMVFIIMIIGSFTYLKIPRELNPDVKVAFLHVSTSLQGINVYDSEKMLLRPMEKHLKTLSGLEEMTGVAQKGYAVLTLKLEAGQNIDKAISNARSKIDLIKNDLPLEASSPIVHEINLSELPILNIALIGEKIPNRTMQNIAEKYQDLIQAVPEVLDVEIVGQQERILEIILDKQMIEKYDLNFEEIIKVIRSNNLMIAAGEIKKDSGNFIIEINGIIDQHQELMDFPIIFDHDKVITIKDIAKVLYRYKTPNKIAKFDNKNAILLKISKKTGANLLLTIAKVKYLMNESKDLLPQDLEVQYSQDVSEKVGEVLRDLENNVIFAIFLVFVIILYFLGLRAALFVAISIPISFLMSIIALNVMGYTLNIVVLFSLILSVGILVDNAIVIVEFAQKRIYLGDNKVTAFKTAIQSMVTPLITSTSTTIVVFLPLMFWPGMIGKFMFFLPVTLISTLTSSLISALIFIPAFGRIFAKKSNNVADENLEIGEFSNLNFFYTKYLNILKIILQHPKKFILLIIFISISIIASYVALGKGLEFFPDVEPDNAFIEIKNSDNLSLSEKNEIVNLVEKKVLKYRNELKSLFTEIGNLDDTTIGRITIEFADWQKRRSAYEIIEDLRNDNANIPGCTIEMNIEKKMGDQKAIRLDIASYDMDLLTDYNRNIQDIMQKIGGFIDIEDTQSVDKVAFEIKINRQEAAKYGLTVAHISSIIQLLTDDGLYISKFNPNDSDEEVDIVLKFPEDHSLITEINNLKISSKFGLVPINHFIQMIPKNSKSQITKINGNNTISIKANVAKGLITDNQLQKLKQALNKEAINQNVTINFAGEDKDQQETQAFLKNAFLIALAMVILIIIIQFNSFFDAFVILTSVFFSTIGVYLGLLITGRPFGVVMCGVGIVTLIGIVVNNNIILIDAYRFNLLNKMSNYEAILTASISRLRPILLTAGTTILGLMPMVFCTSFDFLSLSVEVGAPSGQWWTQLSTSIAGGLLFATIITLFLTPALLILNKHAKCIDNE